MSFILKKREIVKFAKDRVALGLLVAIFFVVVVLVIITGFTIRVSDVQIPTRHSDYGITNIYRDKWYALLAFSIFSVIVFCVNGYISVRAYSIRKGLGLGVLVLSLLIVITGLRVATAVFGIS